MARLALAFAAFFRVLFDGLLAARVREALSGAPPVKELPKPEGRPDGSPHHVGPGLHVLAVLQREGRLLDFIEEDITSASDEDVGAAARLVHEGCRKAVRQYMKLGPVVAHEEGAPYTVPAGFDAGAIRLTGNVVGAPPFQGSLKHRGWKATEVTLPEPPKGMDPQVLAPAEVEL
jgi:hypothetical protein